MTPDLGKPISNHHMPKISMIAAMGLNRVIGKGSEIPWKVDGEQFIFKLLTLDGMVIMGRKTYESLGKGLPNRTNIVITRDENFIAPNCIVVGSIEEAINAIGTKEKVFFIGGGEIYKQAMKYVDSIYLTIIQKEFEGDVYFPEINPEEFKETKSVTFTTNSEFKLHLFQRISQTN